MSLGNFKLVYVMHFNQRLNAPCMLDHYFMIFLLLEMSSSSLHPSNSIGLPLIAVMSN